MSRRRVPQEVSFPDSDTTVLGKELEQNRQSSVDSKEMSEMTKEEARALFDEMYEQRLVRDEEHRLEMEAFDKRLAEVAQLGGGNYTAIPWEQPVATTRKPMRAPELKNRSTEQAPSTSEAFEEHRKADIGHAALNTMLPEQDMPEKKQQASGSEERSGNRVAKKSTHAAKVHHNTPKPSLTAEDRPKPKPRPSINPASATTPMHLKPVDLGATVEAKPEPGKTTDQDEFLRPASRSESDEQENRTAPRPEAPKTRIPVQTPESVNTTLLEKKLAEFKARTKDNPVSSSAAYRPVAPAVAARRAAAAANFVPTGITSIDKAEENKALKPLESTYFGEQKVEVTAKNEAFGGGAPLLTFVDKEGNVNYAPKDQIETKNNQEAAEATKGWFSKQKEKFGIRFWSAVWAAKEFASETHDKLLDLGTEGMGPVEKLKKQKRNRIFMMVGASALGAAIIGDHIIHIVNNANGTEAVAAALPPAANSSEGAPTVAESLNLSPQDIFRVQPEPNAVETITPTIQDDLNGATNAQAQKFPSQEVREIWAGDSADTVTPPTYEAYANTNYEIPSGQGGLELFGNLDIGSDKWDAHQYELVARFPDDFTYIEGEGVLIKHSGWLSPQAQQYIETLR